MKRIPAVTVASVCLLLILLLSPAALAAENYWDVWSDDWYHDAVQYAGDRGLMTGVGGGCFDPQGDVTRAMIVTVVYRMAGSPVASGPCPFADVAAGSWYEQGVTWAASKGVVSGYSADSFGPEDRVSREQLAAVCYRYAQYQGYDVSGRADISVFADADQVHDWGTEALSWACAAGLINGVGGDLLDPRGRSTRAQAAAILMRFELNVAGLPAPEPAPPVIPTAAEQRAKELTAAMTLEEKVGQMFLARCPEQGAGNKAAALHLGGYVLFYRDVAGLTKDQLRSAIAGWQQQAEIPLFISVDEEGGVVNRVSLNPALRSSPFASPQSIYSSGGLTALTADAREKGRLLHDLGFNIDLAPVADVSTSPYDFIYDRAIGRNARITAEAVAAQVRGLREGGVAATLKHFPGYGNNGDTHYGVVTDWRPARTFYDSDLLPFRAGIEAGAGLVLVCHNRVSAFDDRLPASLSPVIHRLLREKLDFQGLIVTDDLAMGGVTQLYGVEELAVLAVAAGNDLLLSSDPETQIAAVLRAVREGRLAESQIDAAVERILRSKIEAGLIPLPAPEEEVLFTGDEAGDDTDEAGDEALPDAA